MLEVMVYINKVVFLFNCVQNLLKQNLYHYCISWREACCNTAIHDAIQITSYSKRGVWGKTFYVTINFIAVVCMAIIAGFRDQVWVQISDISGAVSYTHLDVYKRQPS